MLTPAAPALAVPFPTPYPPGGPTPIGVPTIIPGPTPTAVPPSSTANPPANPNVVIDTAHVRYTSTGPARPGGSADQHTINFADCKSGGWSVAIPVKTRASTGTLQVWAGESCAGTALSSAQCTALPEPTGDVYTVTVPEVMRALGITDCNDTSGRTAGHTVNVHFVLAGGPGGTSDPANVATFQVRVDLLGPRAPEFVVDEKDGMLELQVPPAMGMSSAALDTDAVQFAAFVVPVQQSDAGEASELPEGATRNCPPGIAPIDMGRTRLPNGASAPAGGKVFPGTFPLRLDGLDNGQLYAVAVVGVDRAGNIGAPSAMVCGTPQPAESFFKLYCQDGGAACFGGCGSCQVGEHRDVVWPGILAAGATLGFVLRRRARARRKNGSGAA
ncbi:MAG: hypothetical protein QM820_11515 [Minicystis sp.]